MNNEQIWQGTMFEALQYTLKGDGLRAVSEDDDPNQAANRQFLYGEAEDLVWRNDAGLESRTLYAHHASFEGNLYRQSPGYELREMTLLAAMAYAQEMGLEWLESISGYRHHLTESGQAMFIKPTNPEDIWSPWPRGILDPAPFTWRIPTDSQWVPLTVAEVEALGVQDA